MKILKHYIYNRIKNHDILRSKYNRVYVRTIYWELQNTAEREIKDGRYNANSSKACLWGDMHSI